MWLYVNWPTQFSSSSLIPDTLRSRLRDKRRFVVTELNPKGFERTRCCPLIKAGDVIGAARVLTSADQRLAKQVLV